MNTSTNYTKGSIRIILGLILVLGSVGAIEQSVTFPVTSIILAIFGIFSVYSGATASNL